MMLDFIYDLIDLVLVLIPAPLRNSRFYLSLRADSLVYTLKVMGEIPDERHARALYDLFSVCDDPLVYGAWCRMRENGWPEMTGRDELEIKGMANAARALLVDENDDPCRLPTDLWWWLNKFVAQYKPAN